MLQIDLEKIPLDSQDEEWIRGEIQRRVLAHQIPTPTHKDLSRLVVVNPDNQTVHPAPPSLEAVLRRSHVPIHIGGADIPAQQIVQRIIEGKDPLRVLVIQTRNPYPGLSDFLVHSNSLRREHPAMRIIIDGSTASVFSQLQALIGQGWHLLILWKTGGESTYNDLEKFTQAVSYRPSASMLSRPFFRALRFRHHIHAPLQTCAPQQMGALGREYWIESSVVRGNKNLQPRVIEVPMQKIHSWLLSTTQGPDFSGMRVNNTNITPQTLRTNEALRAWLTKEALQSVTITQDSRHVQSVRMTEVEALRINVITGEVAFMLKPPEKKHHLDDAIAFVLFLQPTQSQNNDKTNGTAKTTGKQEVPNQQKEGYWDDLSLDMDSVSADAQSQGRNPLPEEAASLANSATSAETGETTEVPVLRVRLDRLSTSTKYATIGNALQHTVFECWVDSILRNQLAIQRKQQHYSRQLRFGVVGPLAGQIVHLLQRFGLKHWISKDRLYYLGENPKSFSDSQTIVEETKKDWETLLNTIKQIVHYGQNDSLGMAHIWRTMRISLELTDQQPALDFSQVTAEQLNGIYNEMNQLRMLLRQEFQGRFQLDAQEADFFSRIVDCRKAALIARKLLNLRQGLWGRALPKNSKPDLIIHSNNTSLSQQHTNWGLPSIACSELLSNTKHVAVFEENAITFGTLLEEKLGFAEHSIRENGGTLSRPSELMNAFGEQVKKTIEHYQTQAQTLQTLKENHPTGQLPADIDRERAEFLSHIAWMQTELKNLTPKMEEAQADREHALKTLPLPPEHAKDAAHALKSLGILEKQHSVQTLKIIDDWKHTAMRVAQGLHKGKEHAIELMSLRAQWLQQNLMVLMSKHRQTSPQRWHTHVSHLQDTSAVQLMQMEEETRAAAETLQHKITLYEQNIVLRDRGREKVLENLDKQRNQLATTIHSLNQQTDALAESFLTSLTNLIRQQLNAVGETLLYSTAIEKLGMLQEDEIKKMFGVRITAINTQIEYEAVRSVRLQEGAAPIAPTSRITAEDVTKMRALATQAKQRILQREHGLEQALLSLQGISKPTLQAVELLVNLKLHRQTLSMAVLQCHRVGLSQRRLQTRLEQAKKDMGDLDNVLHQRIVPAKARLLEMVFVPEAKQEARILKQSETLLRDALNMKDKAIETLLLDRTIQKRFHISQFLRGAIVESDPTDPETKALRIITQALRMLGEAAGKTLLHWKTPMARDAQPFSLGQIPLQNTAQHLHQKLEHLKPETYPTWVALPVNMPIETVLQTINAFHKQSRVDLPITFIWTGRFHGKTLQQNPTLRNLYFQMAKHNLLINFHEVPMANNVKDACHYLLQETLGSCQDAPLPPKQQAS